MMFKVAIMFALVAFVAADTQQDQVGAQSIMVKDVLPYPYKSADTPNYAPINYADAGSFLLAPIDEPKTAISIKEHLVAGAWAVGKFVVHNIVALVVGVVIALGVCKLTPICYIVSEKFHNAEKFRSEMRSLITPDRISTASQFLQRAIEKYTKA